MNAISGKSKQEASLRAMVKHYLKRAREIEAHLTKKPDEWGKFQNEFNSEVNAVFRNIMDFEKENLLLGRDDKVYKLKQFFISKFRKIFLKGAYNEWAFKKPFGYAGDFKIIDGIYQNNLASDGFVRLFDNYCMMSAISVAVRNRKEDFKRLLREFVADNIGRRLRIMDLACGPCRELQELLSLDPALYRNVIFDCYDYDDKAIGYAKELLAGHPNVNFIKENAMRIAFRKNISELIDKKYDLIYSTGLFDYFTERVGIGLIVNLRKLLSPKGILAISTMSDKYSNPSVYYMEWATEWNLVYRNEKEFKNIFISAGFSADELKIEYEQQAIMQYMIATKIS